MRQEDEKLQIKNEILLEITKYEKLINRRNQRILNSQNNNQKKLKAVNNSNSNNKSSKRINKQSNNQTIKHAIKLLCFSEQILFSFFKFSI